MNEQIREIAVAADAWCDQNHLGLFDPMYDLKWEEKFAQLIVQSCIKHIEEERYKLAESLDTEYDDGYVDGMYRAEYKLREHFGVE